VAAAAEAEPSFRLLRNAEVVGVIWGSGRSGHGADRVVGVTYCEQNGETKEVRAELTVACDGRLSTVRSAVGLEPHRFGAPMDVWWFRLPRRPDDPSGLADVLRAGHATIMIDRGDYYQIAYVLPKGTDAEMRAQGIEVLQRALVSMVPWLVDRVDKLTSVDDVKLLDVQLNRLPRWYSDGVLFIGDAAHAMSPVGGVGINLAVADAVAAARILADPLHAGRVSTGQLARVQRRRWFPTLILQAAQRMIHDDPLQPDRGRGGRKQCRTTRRASGKQIVGIAAGRRLPGGDRPAARACAEVRQAPRVGQRNAPHQQNHGRRAGRESMMSKWCCTLNPPTNRPTVPPRKPLKRRRK
jgi:2-polyprenyl-6-methoxyphenol hydroxylase-like FAD-dependent oxidoreductase